MARPYHSPSSVALGARCERAWALTYIDGWRSPATPANLLGSALHRVFEAYYRGLRGPQAPDWTSRAGVIAQSALHLLPLPSSCLISEPEEALGGPWISPEERVLLRHDGDSVAYAPDGCRDDSPPGRALIVDGCRYAGFRDLLVQIPQSDADQIGATHVVDGWLLVDYKSTSSVARYAMTPSELERDFAANLYAIDVAYRTGLDWVACRWPYIETRATRRAYPTDCTINVRYAIEIVAARSELVRRLDLYERSDDAPCNTDACADYGGRSCHTSKGGPCSARRSIAALIRAHTKGTQEMAINPEAAAKFDLLRKKMSAPTDTPEPPQDDVVDSSVDSAEDEPAPTATVAPAPKAAPKAPTKAAPKPAPKPAPKTEAPDPETVARFAAAVAAAQSVVDSILSMTSGLDAAVAARDAAIRDLRGALS